VQQCAPATRRFRHRLVRSRGLNGTKPVTFLARWPAGKAMQHEQIVEDLNRFLGGWAAHLRFGNSAARFEKIRSYSRIRMALFISKRKRRSREFGWWVVAYQSPDQLGLINLSGIVIDPRNFRDSRGSRMPAVNGVGEPRAGEPHARFEAAGTWKRSRPGQGHWGGATDWETGGHEGPRP